MNVLPQADFEFELIDDVVVIFDRDNGDYNVNNDIRNVLQHIDTELGGIQQRPVIYRDSTKTFDGIHHTGSQFDGFYAINETVLEAAIHKLRQVAA